MSLETELKKIGNNLQQLTDAVVTLTAEMETFKGAKAVVAAPSTLGDAPAVATGKDVEAAEDVADNTVVDINKNEGVTGNTAETVITDEVMTIPEANAELQRIVGEIGDGGVAIRDLLKKHNAISLAQIPAENLRSLIDEAQALSPAKQA